MDSIVQNGTGNLLAGGECADEFCRGLWCHASDNVDWHWLFRNAAAAGIRRHAMAAQSDITLAACPTPLRGRVLFVGATGVAA